MNEYAIDNRRVVERAYAALAAGDIDAFAKPIAPGIAGKVLRKVLHPFTEEARDLRIEAREFTLTPGRVVVAGRCTATRRADGADLTASFRHEWRVTYGVAWQFAQSVWS